MNKAEQAKELDELISRFRRVMKSMVEEDALSPAQRYAAEIAQKLAAPAAPAPSKLTREQVLAKAKELFEQQSSQRLANQLQKSGIMGARPPPPRQPTKEDQEAWLVNNGLGQTEEMLKNEESQWGNSLNNWLSEATKPINQRFKSEAEERAYWDSIKINGGSGNEGAGY